MAVRPKIQRNEIKNPRNSGHKLGQISEEADGGSKVKGQLKKFVSTANLSTNITDKKSQDSSLAGKSGNDNAPKMSLAAGSLDDKPKAKALVETKLSNGPKSKLLSSFRSKKSLPKVDNGGQENDQNVGNNVDEMTKATGAKMKQNVGGSKIGVDTKKPDDSKELGGRKPDDSMHTSPNATAPPKKKNKCITSKLKLVKK